MSQWEFFERIGRRLGLEQDALRKWRVRGVPRIHRLTIVDAAAEEGFELDRSAFDNPPGRRRQTEDSINAS